MRPPLRRSPASTSTRVASSDDSSSTWVSVDTELQTLLESALGRRLGTVRVRPYAYGTSHPLYELDLGDERLLLKDLGVPHTAKPQWLHDSQREIEVYRDVLSAAGIGPALRAVIGARLLLEKVEGVELWQLEHDAWVRVARWLARAHDRLAPFAGRPHLLSIDASYFGPWPERAGLTGDLARAHSRAAKRLLALPRVLIHNELYPSNVIVADERIVPVDWELTAVGPAVLDLAALATGWNGEELEQILSAYGGVDLRDYAAARMHLAVRWLGWSTEWTPPPEHRYDWLAEATSAAALL